MLISLRTVVLAYWGFAILLATIAIPLTLRAAWRAQPSALLNWRGVKAFSTFLGLIGFFLLALNFEQTVRASLTDDARRSIQSAFLSMKFKVLYERSIACSRAQFDERAGQACFDFTYLDEAIDIYRDLQGPFKTLSPWRRNIVSGGGIQRVDDIGTVLSQVNNSLENMQNSWAAFELSPILKFEVRFWMSLVSLILVLIAVAGSLGESIYQYKQTRDASRRAEATGK
jgi:hypothetical protein